MTTLHNLEEAIHFLARDAGALKSALATVATLVDAMPDTEDNRRDNLVEAVELASHVHDMLIEHLGEAQQFDARARGEVPNEHAQAGKHVHTPAVRE